jgi:hypothetical protein
MTVYSFYSYKGGVGRSMTLANLAAMFYRRPLDVVVVDWDLEAPGIERYFAPRYPAAEPAKVSDRVGLCDLIAHYRTTVATPPAFGRPATPPYPPIDDYLITLDENDGYRLRLMPAGRRRDWAAYAEFVQSFDWADFYANWAGGGFFDWLRTQLRRSADVVLIDTRTGITEMGGVATRHMADVVVVMFAGNEENMESSARMAETFLATGDGDRGVEVILVPSRIDDSDSGEFSGFLARLAEMERRLPPTRSPDGWQARDLLLPYRPRLAFREQLVVGDDELQSVFRPIVEGYRNIAAQMQQLAPSDSRLRLGPDVARGRVYLLQQKHQTDVGNRVRRILEGDRYEVAPSPTATSYDVDEEVLASAGCIVALIDESTSTSRSLRKLLSFAEQLGKPVIPVLLESTVRIPIQLADVQSLQWVPDDPDGRMLDALLRAVRTVTAAPTASEPGRPAVFLCYGGDDESRAEQVADGLEARGITTWLDTRITAGTNFAEERQRALDDAGALVVLASSALDASRSAQQEVAYANIRNKVILPVRFGDEPPALWLSPWPAVDAADQPFESVIDRVAEMVRARTSTHPV